MRSELTREVNIDRCMIWQNDSGIGHIDINSYALEQLCLEAPESTSQLVREECKGLENTDKQVHVL